METMETKMETKKAKKSEEIFYCESCDYKCFRKYDFNKHILTAKHKNTTKETQKSEKSEYNFTCQKCNKEFKNRSGYWKHKQKCLKDENKVNESSENEVSILTNLMFEMVKSNGELQKQMLELCKNTSINNTNNTNNTINNNNKTFNLQVFLNETCKDAMNIMDFADSIKISLSDIESIGELGYVNGMSKLIIKHLNALDENMRPVHCNDLKRSSLFVKDANVWAKEDENNNKLKNAIRHIAHKNICALPEWRKKYPDCIYSESKKSDQYNHIVIEAMGGSGDNDDEKAEKIISKIAKTITINK
jgi:hypothetical protein